MTQHAFGVRIRSYLAWGPTLGMRTRSQKLLSFHACDHVPLVQPAPFGCAVRANLKDVFFQVNRMNPNFFHVLQAPWQACLTIFGIFRRPMHFLGFSRWKNPKTLPGRDATCVRCPDSFISCVGAYIGHAHTLAKIGFVSCMRSHIPSATSTVRVCQ